MEKMAQVLILFVNKYYVVRYSQCLVQKINLSDRILVSKRRLLRVYVQ